jgi:pyruvate/2-oxoglutarate dehydrogenase complex dihydrolipoamide dehydrogenase (E3) component
MPSTYPRYPSRDQVVEYLERYATEMALRPQFGEAAVTIYRESASWEIETTLDRYRSRNVVVATGWSRVPVRPAWPRMDQFEGPILHSAEYANGARFCGLRVLVVGFGNSGGEIAIDLVEHGAEVQLAVRGPINVVPKEVLGLPVLSASILTSKLPHRLADLLTSPIRRWYYGDIGRYGLSSAGEGPMAQIERRRRIPLIDIGTIDLIRRGKIAVRPGIDSFSRNRVRFVDGHADEFDAVVLATGFLPRVDEFLPEAQAALDEYGSPVSSGVEALPGLYFCGFFVSPTGMLREIGVEARRIARHIAGRSP